MNNDNLITAELDFVNERSRLIFPLIDADNRFTGNGHENDCIGYLLATGTVAKFKIRRIYPNHETLEIYERIFKEIKK